MTVSSSHTPHHFSYFPRSSVHYKITRIITKPYRKSINIQIKFTPGFFTWLPFTPQPLETPVQ